MIKLDKLLKATANKRRLAILKYLKTAREATVGDIAESIKLSFKATSKHLKILDDVDIVEKEQRSKQVYYCLSGNQNSLVKHLLSIL